MKRILIGSLFLLFAVSMSAQTPDFKAQWERQTRNVGFDGVGVETIIDKWEAAEPGNKDMLLARYRYFIARAKYTEVVPKYQTRFLGAAPTVVLKDENGNDVGFFEETFYDDEPFGQAQKILDKLISNNPLEISYRYEKISALISYEKEYPEMAAVELNKLIDYNASQHPCWLYQGELMSSENFLDGIQEYCYSFFAIKSETSLEVFKSVSEKMSKLYPQYPVFLSNQGSYWLLKGNSGKALKCYNQVLKIDPKDYSAIKNCILIARRNNDTKLELKYLPMLVEVAESDAERLSAQGRLQALSVK